MSCEKAILSKLASHHGIPNDITTELVARIRNSDNVDRFHANGPVNFYDISKAQYESYNDPISIQETPEIKNMHDMLTFITKLKKANIAPSQIHDLISAFTKNIKSSCECPYKRDVYGRLLKTCTCEE